MTLKQLCFSFKGRINRSIWWVCLAGITMVILASIIFTEWAGFYGATYHGSRDNPDPPSVRPPSAIGIIICLWVPTWASFFVGLAATVKRLHDTNRSGVYALMALIPIIGLLYLLVCCGFLKGTDGENDYGPPVDKIT